MSIINGIAGGSPTGGIQGTTGAMGATGVHGATGIRGATGIQGVQGATGVQGPSDASLIAYSPSVPTAWGASVPTSVQNALDLLALHDAPVS